MITVKITSKYKITTQFKSSVPRNIKAQIHTYIIYRLHRDCRLKFINYKHTPLVYSHKHQGDLRNINLQLVDDQTVLRLSSVTAPPAH